MSDEQLLGILKQLGDENFKEFKWYLGKDSNGFIPTCSLETASRLQTVDLIAQTYPDRALVVTKNLLEKIGRHDLAGKLSVAGPGCSGAAATTTQAMTKTHEEDKSAREKLMTGRNKFIDGITDTNLESLLGGLLVTKVINDGEAEAVRGSVHKLRSDKARELVDMVRRKGNKVCSIMMGILSEKDPILVEEMCK